MTTTKIILKDSDEAATYRTDLKGWVSRNGTYFGDSPQAESIARFEGCTHVRCSTCGRPAEKGYTACNACKADKALAKFLEMPEAEWESPTLLWSQTKDEFYRSPEEALQTVETREELADLRLILCEPRYVEQLKYEDFEEWNHYDEWSIPPELEQAIEDFNRAVKGIIMSWHPGKTRLKI